MIIRATKKEVLWFILKANPNKGKGVAPSNVDEKKRIFIVRHDTVNQIKTSWKTSRL
jgi:hypothetical protein